MAQYDTTTPFLHVKANCVAYYDLIMDKNFLPQFILKNYCCPTSTSSLLSTLEKSSSNEVPPRIFKHLKKLEFLIQLLSNACLFFPLLIVNLCEKQSNQRCKIMIRIQLFFSLLQTYYIKEIVMILDIFSIIRPTHTFPLFQTVEAIEKLYPPFLS